MWDESARGGESDVKRLRVSGQARPFLHGGLKEKERWRAFEEEDSGLLSRHSLISAG
jgi:hypothetical protein